MYEVKHFIAKIDTANYIANYRDADKFMAYCRECNRYGTCWACPPFDFDAQGYVSSYGTAYVIGSKIVPHADVIKANTDPESSKETSYRMIEAVRLTLDRNLLAWEKHYPGSKAFFAGTCHICHLENCTRLKRQPCIAPDRIRPSLEALGFDLGKTALELLGIEMKWSSDGLLPKYFTLVSGFFVKQDIPGLVGRMSEALSAERDDRYLAQKMSKTSIEKRSKI